MLRLLLCLSLVLVPGLAAGAKPEATSADDLMVVNCLLPGQIRQLGTRTTYVSARRPVRTTALECRVKGGEYVVSDRANLKSALKVWLQAAEAGDKEAQTTLGEIFEQGVGVPPDYDAARRWYEQAAAKDFPRALTNLGNLYERGLGVAQDSAKALTYYRRAAGLPADTPALSIDTTVDVAPVQLLVTRETEKLEAALAALQTQTVELRAALAASQREVDALSAEAAREVVSARDEGRAAAEAVARQRQEQTLAAHEQRVQDYEANLAARDQQIARLQETVNALRTESADTAQVEAELASLKQLISDQQARLEAGSAALASSTETRSELEQTVADQSRMLAERDEQARQQLDELNRLLSEVASLRDRQRQPAMPVTPQVNVAGPAISIIEPVLPVTRGLVKVRIPRPTNGVSIMRIIGRVTAPAGLLDLSINSVPVSTNPAGVFTYELNARDGSDVVVAAIDNQGKRSDLRFALARSLPPPAPELPTVDLGNYRALLIGNSNYRHLPQLLTPANDIAALQQILSQQYGFQVDTLEDASRYEILSALNELRATLTSEDNLLIYYAGHGELDRANMRGHWLPVDAETTSTANWLSNVAITDILNVIQAKQIMLVVDSCYSGTLTRSSLTQIDTAMTEAERATWLNLMAKKKARVVLTSGGLAPVLDSGGGAHSVFAKAFLEALRTNGELLTGRSLYQAVAARVAHAAQAFEFEQIPAYAPIARSGHEAGDFMLLPTRL